MCPISWLRLDSTLTIRSEPDRVQPRLRPIPQQRTIQRPSAVFESELSCSTPQPDLETVSMRPRERGMYFASFYSPLLVLPVF